MLLNDTLQECLSEAESSRYVIYKKKQLTRRDRRLCLCPSCPSSYFLVCSDGASG